MPLTMNDALFIYCMLKKGQQNIILLLQKYISASEFTTLPNGYLPDILQATHLYAFSTSGFFVFICIDITLKGLINN